jgi:enamine deaminase RidA (YjgF/YER057c/UK114 family)
MIDQPQTTPLQRLEALGLTLPQAPAPLASYIPTTVVPIGDGRVLVFVAGQVAMRDGAPVQRGRVPDEVSLEAAQENARLVCLNVLAQLEKTVGLANVEQVLQVTGYVRCSDSFDQQPAVLNAASELIVAVLGDAGRHTRAAVGTNALPGGVPVEMTAIAVARSG